MTHSSCSIIAVIWRLHKYSLRPAQAPPDLCISTACDRSVVLKTTEADFDCTCAGCIFLSNAAYAQATLLWAFSTILLYKFYRCPEFGRLHCCQR